MWTRISCSLLQAQKNFTHHLVRRFCLRINRIQSNVVLMKIHRNLLMWRTSEQSTGQVYPTGISLPHCRYHIKASATGLCGRGETYHSCRYYSSMKDDDIVKSWINEIKDDFEKESKLAARNKPENEQFGESASDISESVENGIRTRTDDLQTDVENDIDKLEKLGFTTEEIIDLLKNAKKFDENLIEDEYELSDSESENEQSKEPGEGINNKGDTLSDENLGNEGKGAAEKSADNNKMLTEDWAVVKMKPDIKTDWSVVEIEDFVKIAEPEPDVEEDWHSPVDLVCGKTGVYDIEELIEVLRHDNAQDIITIRMPKELNFADFMVITTANSLRHIKAITNDVKLIFKKKRQSSDDVLKVEGESSDWCALDLGNIILHIFLQAKREMYDLETLWTVGVKFDPQCEEDETDPYVFSVDDLPWLKELEYQQENTGQSPNQASDSLEKARERKHQQ